jgi:hypothetical protein
VWRALLLLLLRLLVICTTVRVLFAGYYDPLPNWTHLHAALWRVPWCLAPLVVVAGAAGATQNAWNTSRSMSILRLPRLALALALGMAFICTARRYDGITAPLIDLVPYEIGCAIVLLTVLSGPTTEPPLSRALYGAGLATLVLAVVFPLR